MICSGSTYNYCMCYFEFKDINKGFAKMLDTSVIQDRHDIYSKQEAFPAIWPLCMTPGGLLYNPVPICPTYISSHIDFLWNSWLPLAWLCIHSLLSASAIAFHPRWHSPPFSILFYCLSLVEILTSDSNCLIVSLRHQSLILPCSLRTRSYKSMPSAHQWTASLWWL